MGQKIGKTGVVEMGVGEMGVICFVQGEKSVWDLLSTLSNQCGMFCPPWRSSVGSFVRPAKNGMGAFVHGIFCPAPKRATESQNIKIHGTLYLYEAN